MVGSIVSGNLVAVGFSDGYIRIIDYTTATISATLHRHYYSAIKVPTSVITIPTTPYMIASAGPDFYVRMSW